MLNVFELATEKIPIISRTCNPRDSDGVRTINSEPFVRSWFRLIPFLIPFWFRLILLTFHHWNQKIRGSLWNDRRARPWGQRIRNSELRNTPGHGGGCSLSQLGARFRSHDLWRGKDFTTSHKCFSTKIKTGRLGSGFIPQLYRFGFADFVRFYWFL